MFENNLINPSRFWARYNPNGAAIIFEGTTLTYRELDIRTDELACGLQKLYGVRPGDRVALVADNCMEWCEMMIAILKAGGIMVPLNVRLVATELKTMIGKCGALLVICDKSHRERADAVRAALTNLQVVEIGTREFESLRLKGATPTSVDLGLETPAVLAFTSGTTGIPKGVILTHGNIWEFCMNMGFWLDFHSLSRTLWPAPLAYTAGYNGNFLVTYVHGGTLYLLPSFDAKRCLEILSKEGITSFGGAVVMFEQIMALPEFKDADLSKLAHPCCGAAVVSQTVLKTWQDKGCRLQQAYGLTEGSCSICYTPDWATIEKAHTAGLPAPNTKIRVVDDKGKECPPGVRGEILVAGPTVTKGYWNDPEATKSLIKEGWLHTGDIGIFDEDGFLIIVDRKKDMVISGGINMYPAEIEAEIYNIPGVVEVAVIGVPDEKWGETAVAIIRTDRDISIQEIIDHCNANMADYKVPRYVVFVDEPMPRTMSGKLEKYVLREQYSDLPKKMKKVR